MGTPAYVEHGRIHFETKEAAGEALPLIRGWIDRANRGALDEAVEGENGDYQIYDTDVEYDFVVFRADSGRIYNMVWQMENFLKFVKTLPGVCVMEAPVTIIDEDSSVYWNKEDEEEILVD